MLGVKRIMAAVCAMLEPIIPAAPTIVNLSFVKKFIIGCILNVDDSADTGDFFERQIYKMLSKPTSQNLIIKTKADNL